MARRTFWLAAGVAIGAGSSLWVERKVRRTLSEAAARLQPDALVAEVGRSARDAAASAGGRLRDALASGHGEMQRREEELWAELAARGTGGPPSGTAPPSPPPAVEPEPEPQTAGGSRSRRQRGVRRLARATRGSTSHAAT
jgi:hypothetical protein